MNKEKQQFYLVDLKILPEAIKKNYQSQGNAGKRRILFHQ